MVRRMDAAAHLTVIRVDRIAGMLRSKTGASLPRGISERVGKNSLRAKVTVFTNYRRSFSQPRVQHLRSKTVSAVLFSLDYIDLSL